MGVGWGSSVRLLLRDRATASWGWGKGVIAIAADCVTVELRIGAGGGGGGAGQLRSPLTASTAPWDWEKGALSPKLPWLFELRCPRRFALVGPRKAVKTRPNGRNNSRGKLKGRYYSVKKP